MHRRTQLGLIAAAAAAAATGASIAAAQAPPPPAPGGPGQPGGFPGRPPGRPAPGSAAQFIPPPMMGPATPELARKMAAIWALREIQNLRMTSRDITAALPLLKEMREAEKALEGRAGEALEQERRALLAAGPDTQVPPTSGERLRDANEQFRRQSERAWDSLFEKLGPNVASGLQRILHGGMMFPPMGGPPPGAPSGFGPGPGFGQGPGRPGAAPPGADGFPGPPGRPGPGEVGPPPAPGQQPPGDPRFQPRPGGQGGLPPQGQPGGRGVGRPQGAPGAPTLPNRPTGPGAPGFGVPGGMGFGGPGFGPPSRISLSELIELLEQKLSAMRR